jgi:hypothetical protein
LHETASGNPIDIIPEGEPWTTREELPGFAQKIVTPGREGRDKKARGNRANFHDLPSVHAEFPPLQENRAELRRGLLSRVCIRDRPSAARLQGLTDKKTNLQMAWGVVRRIWILDISSGGLVLTRTYPSGDLAVKGCRKVLVIPALLQIFYQVL